MLGSFLTFDLSIKIEILLALLTVSMHRPYPRHIKVPGTYERVCRCDQDT